MSREYRDLLVKGAPEGEELEEKARVRGLIPSKRSGGSSRLSTRVGMRAFGLVKAKKQGRGKRTLARLNRVQSFLRTRRTFGSRPDGSGLARTGRYF